MITLGPQLARRLERLAIRVRRAFAGKTQGERRSTKRGSSIEFADYREYVPGDDPRSLDWNAAARMDRLYLKLYVEEEDLSVHFLLDASASMGFGTPPKIEFARLATAALAYIGLANLDRVTVVPYALGRGEALGPKRGKSQVFRLLEFLGSVEPSGSTSLGRAVREFIGANARRGPVFVISDFLDPDGYEKPLAMLRHAGFQPMAVHVMAPDELDAPDGDELRLVDAETGATVDVSLSASVAKAYRARVQAFRNELETWCTRRDMSYVFARSDEELEAFVVKCLRVMMLET